MKHSLPQFVRRSQRQRKSGRLGKEPAKRISTRRVPNLGALSPAATTETIF